MKIPKIKKLFRSDPRNIFEKIEIFGVFLKLNIHNNGPVSRILFFIITELTSRDVNILIDFSTIFGLNFRLF